MLWEPRGAERHSTGSRWAHRPALAGSTMVWLWPTLITSLQNCSSNRDRGRPPQSSRCWGGLEAGSQLLPEIHIDPKQIHFLVSSPYSYHLLNTPQIVETCSDKLRRSKIYPKPVQISATVPSHHRNFHMYLSHMDGWRLPKASKQSAEMSRDCAGLGHVRFRHGDIDQYQSAKVLISYR